MATKVHLVKAMVFPAVMHGCESWTIEKAERRRTDAFEMWCWRRLESPLENITAVIPTDGDCSHEIKRRLLLGGKVMTNLDSIF